MKQFIFLLAAMFVLSSVGLARTVRCKSDEETLIKHQQAVTAEYRDTASSTTLETATVMLINEKSGDSHLIASAQNIESRKTLTMNSESLEDYLLFELSHDPDDHFRLWLPTDHLQKASFRAFFNASFDGKPGPMRRLECRPAVE